MQNQREDLGEILEQIDISLYLDREGIEHKKTHGSSGAQLNVKDCPVCGSSNWKVYLNEDSGLGNCFSGDHPPDKNFNKFSFIKAHIGLESNREVVREIKEVAREMGWRSKRKTSSDVVEKSTTLVLPDSTSIPIQGRNLKYLAERGITAEIAEFFRFRYCKKGDFWYRKRDGGVWFQSYDKRIIIPIYNINGELVSFQGRDISGMAENRYMFPSGFSSTGRYLYNAHNAVGSKRIVINEGVFDVAATKIAMDEEVGMRDVMQVGAFSMHLSDGQGESQLNDLRSLKESGLEDVTFMWDGERNAIINAIEAAIKVRSIGLTARVAILPFGKDPNEVKPEVVRDAYRNATIINKISSARLMAKYKLQRRQSSW